MYQVHTKLTDKVCINRFRLQKGCEICGILTASFPDLKHDNDKEDDLDHDHDGNNDKRSDDDDDDDDDKNGDSNTLFQKAAVTTNVYKIPSALH